MKKVQRQISSWMVAIVFGLITFVALSVFANGLIEITRNGSFLSWIGEVTAYAVMNRLGSKLIAAIAVGCAAGFVANMIAYGKAVKQQRLHRTTHVRFAGSDDSDKTRTA